MVKRRRLETPSTDDLSRIEAEFRRETHGRPSVGPGIAPIAQIAADTAARGSVETADARAARARDQADAERLRQAEGQGLLIVERAAVADRGVRTGTPRRAGNALWPFVGLSTAARHAGAA